MQQSEQERQQHRHHHDHHDHHDHRHHRHPQSEHEGSRESRSTETCTYVCIWEGWYRSHPKMVVTGPGEDARPFSFDAHEVGSTVFNILSAFQNVPREIREWLCTIVQLL